jgi:hypothetical protein
MTAEIAILNKSAIALAADSKVTLTIGGRQKTYDTVDKLFSLSKTEPVGAMIYGNAEFMRFPWETILKQYRHQNPHKTFSTVFEWGEDLKAYLLKFFAFNGSDEDEVIMRITMPVLEAITAEFFESLGQSAAEFSKEEAQSALEASIQSHMDALAAEPDFFSEGEWNELIVRIEKVLRAVSNRVLANTFPGLTDLGVQLAALLVQKQIVSASASGLVVAGFGDNELLPSLVSFEIDGIVGGRLKCIERARFDGTRDSEGTIIPFAQSDMVYRFMEGIDPGYAGQILSDVRELLQRNATDTALAGC